MLIQHILTFLSTPDLTHTDVSELHEIRKYQVWDAKRDINWKKTAQHDTLMTNIFEKEQYIHWNIVSIHSWNWSKGTIQNAYTSLDHIVTQLQTATNINQRNYISQKTIPHLPAFTNFFQQKTIIVSDFFRSSEQISVFLQACQQWKTHGLIIPLYTELGKYKHPLVKKYPQFFWEI